MWQTIFKSIINWLQANTFNTILILLASVLVIQFGNKLLAIIIRRAVGRINTDLSEHDVKKRQDTLISMFSTILKVLVWLTAGFTILGSMGINLAPLLAGASVIGVALGFGAQSLIKDLLSGLFIIIENQYRVGDVVDIGGASGTVEQITVRSTIIRDSDGNVHYIPNGTIVHVINKTMGYSRVNLTLSVDIKTNMNKLADIVDEVGAALATDEKWKNKVLEAPHFMNNGDITDTSIGISVVGKTQPSKQWAVMSELRKRLLVALKQNKIKIIEMAGVPRK